MPSQISCPVPEVDTALSPYINSRQETLRIRGLLARHLATHLESGQPNVHEIQHLNSQCPQNIAAVKSSAPEIKKNRLGYLRAAQAKLAAQERHAQLQSSLSDLRTRHYAEAPAQPEAVYDDEVTRGYMSLLRQRSRFAELQVIQTSLDKLLESHPVPIPKDPKIMVKDGIGEQPDLPAERLELPSQDREVEDWVFGLKKEVLETRASMDRANSAREGAQDENRGGEFELRQQVYALNSAREELVGWVEGELAKMNEESEFLEDASPVKKWVTADTPVDASLVDTKIRDSYCQYTTSRAALIEVFDATDRSINTTQPSDVQREGLSKVPQETIVSKVTIASILPHIPHLMRTSDNERSLLQQTVYLQVQLSSASEETKDSLSRLSKESHLLPSSDKGLTAWGKTARQAEAATEEFVTEILQESQNEVKTLDTIVNLSSLQSKVLAFR